MLEGPKDPHPRNSRFRWSRDLAHASIPLAQTDPLGFDWEGLVASRGTVGGHSGPPPLNSLGIDSRNVAPIFPETGGLSYVLCTNK